MNQFRNNARAETVGHGTGQSGAKGKRAKLKTNARALGQWDMGQGKAEAKVKRAKVKTNARALGRWDMGQGKPESKVKRAKVKTNVRAPGQWDMGQLAEFFLSLRFLQPFLSKTI